MWLRELDISLELADMQLSLSSFSVFSSFCLFIFLSFYISAFLSFCLLRLTQINQSLEVIFNAICGWTYGIGLVGWDGYHRS